MSAIDRHTPHHGLTIFNFQSIRHIAIDDPSKIVKVVAQDGKNGETRELSYNNCKVIGNGSFGVVFQARLLGAPKELEDIAIKKVLQDKRFKVRHYPSTYSFASQERSSDPAISPHL